MIELFISLVVFCFIIYLVSNNILKIAHHYISITNHDKYNSILEKILDNAYDSVYKSQIISYSISSVKPGDEQLETIKRNYIKLSFQIMGDNIESMLLKYYGSRDTMIKIMLHYLENRLDNDKIMEYVQKIKSSEEIDDKTTSKISDIIKF